MSRCLNSLVSCNVDPNVGSSNYVFSAMLWHLSERGSRDFRLSCELSLRDLYVDANSHDIIERENYVIIISVNYDIRKNYVTQAGTIYCDVFTFSSYVNFTANIPEMCRVNILRICCPRSSQKAFVTASIIHSQWSFTEEIMTLDMIDIFLCIKIR